MKRLVARLRVRMSGLGIALADLVRLARALARSRTAILVGYTKAHPIYTDVLEDHPPDGFAGYRPSQVPWLAPLDRRVRSRVRLIHADAANLPTVFPASLPTILECESRPPADLLEMPYVRTVFVESRWAGGEPLERGDVALLRPAPALASGRKRQHHHTARRKLILLAVGYGALVKGFDVVARLFEVLRAEFSLRLILAGTFPHNAIHYPEIAATTGERVDIRSLERRLRADPDVDVRPRRRSDVMRLYESADVYLHLSRLETFGYSILEAMSHALPVVATRLHAIPEMVRHGETGYLCDPRGADINSHEWERNVLEEAVDATRALLTSRAHREQMGRAGRERVARAFNIETKRLILADVYRRALDYPVTSPGVAPSVPVGEARLTQRA